MIQRFPTDASLPRALRDGRVGNDASVGNRCIIFIGSHCEIESRLVIGFVETREHHAGVSALELRNGISPARRLAEVETTKSVSKRRRKFQMYLGRTSGKGLGNFQANRFVRFIINNFRGLSGASRCDFRQGDIEIKRVEDDIFRVRRDLQVNRLFARESLGRDVGIKKELVVARRDSRGETLGESHQWEVENDDKTNKRPPDEIAHESAFLNYVGFFKAEISYQQSCSQS